MIMWTRSGNKLIRVKRLVMLNRLIGINSMVKNETNLGDIRN